MPTQFLSPLALLSIIAIATACSPSPQQPASNAASADAAAAQSGTASEDAAPQTAGLITSEPAELTCDGPQVVSVRWDVGAVQPAVELVEIWTGSPPSLFAAGAAAGEAITGQWAMPGTIFILRDKATGRDLDRVTVGGPACG